LLQYIVVGRFFKSRIMTKNMNGFRLNRNGKPILNEQGYKKHLTYQGATYKDEMGTYYFFLREQNGWFIYNT